jgi:hypothetical protein
MQTARPSPSTSATTPPPPTATGEITAAIARLTAEARHTWQHSPNGNAAHARAITVQDCIITAEVTPDGNLIIGLSHTRS